MEGGLSALPQVHTLACLPAFCNTPHTQCTLHTHTHVHTHTTVCTHTTLHTHTVLHTSLGHTVLSAHTFSCIFTSSPPVSYQEGCQNQKKDG